MREEQESVRQVMLLATQMAPRHPVLPSADVQKLRLDLHREEAVTELREAFEKQDLVLVADSLADSLVVILGTAVACGIDIKPVFDEVMRSNLSKFIGGAVKRQDGKFLKGPHYTPPDIAPILALQ